MNGHIHIHLLNQKRILHCLLDSQSGGLGNEGLVYDAI